MDKEVVVHMYRGILCSVAQSCMTVGDPIVCSLQGSSVHGIFLAKKLEQVAISFSKGSSSSRDETHISGSSTLAGWVFLYHWATWEAHTSNGILYVCVLSCFSHAWLFATLYGWWPPRLFCPWDSPDKNTGVGYHASSRESSDSGIQPVALTSPALSGVFFTTSAT